MSLRPAAIVSCLAMCAIAYCGDADKQVADPSSKSAPAKKTADPFLTGPPFTFEQVLRLVHQNTIPMRRRKQAIQQRGLAFLLSPDGINKLRTAGAPDELLDLIRDKAIAAGASCPVAPQPPPPPAPPVQEAPKRPPMGKLAVRCAPAECEVSLNDRPRGSTRDGVLDIAELPVGQWNVTFKRDGYVDRHTVVTVGPEETVAISEILSPTRATQETFGAALLQKVIHAVGVSDIKDPQIAIEAAGTTTTWTCEGRSVEWMLWMRNQSERALFQIKAGGPLREVEFAGSEYRTSKRMRAQDAVQLATDAGLIRDNQLSLLLRRLSNPQFKILANRDTPVVGESCELRAERADERISLSLGEDLLPREVHIETPTSTGSTAIGYSDYADIDGIKYPKTMHIKPEAWKNGIDVHFDSVRWNRTTSTRDYDFKRKPILAFKN